MGLNRRVTKDIQSDIEDLYIKHDEQQSNLADNKQSDVLRSGINRHYRRYVKQTSATLDIGGNLYDMKFNTLVEDMATGVDTTDQITFTFTKNGVFLIHSVISFTDLTQTNGTGYCIMNLVHNGFSRRLVAQHYNHFGNLSLTGHTILRVASGDTFTINVSSVNPSTVYGSAEEERTFLEIMEL